MKRAVSIGTAAVSMNNDPRSLPHDRGARRAGKAFVCMIAYTNYAIDARVRREAETLAAKGFEVLCLTTANGAERATLPLGWRQRAGAWRAGSTAARARLPIWPRTCVS